MTDCDDVRGPWPYKFPPEMSVDEFIKKLPRTPVYRSKAKSLLQNCGYKCVRDIVIDFDDHLIQTKPNAGRKTLRYLWCVLMNGVAPEPDPFDAGEQAAKRFHDKNKKRRELAFYLRSQGLSLTEIAARLGCCRSTVWVMLKKARSLP